jgi:asparagine synthase (glutamine-hydrolysing)
MCGISLLFGKNGSKESLDHMLDNIQRRGPDGRGVFHLDNVFIGHVRLSLIDSELGSQPMTSNGCTISYNGEIYNYLQLKNELKDYPFRTNSDTEVILALYLTYGIEKTLQKLNGMFSFVIYDSSKRKVIAATDRYKIKPLYCYYNDDTWYIFSEPKALKGLVKFDVDYSGLYNWVTSSVCIKDRSFFKDIVSLPPGCWFEFDSNSRAYKTNAYYRIGSLNTTLSQTEVEEKILHLIDVSVKQQTQTDNSNLIVMQSGGIDSNLISYFLHKNNYNFETFTGNFQYKRSLENGEIEIAKQVSQLYNANYNEVPITEDSFINNIRDFVFAVNYPKMGPSFFSKFVMMKQMQHKTKIAFSGNGSDEIFAGYSWILNEVFYHKLFSNKSLNTAFCDIAIKKQQQNFKTYPSDHQWYLSKRWNINPFINDNFFTEHEKQNRFEANQTFNDVRDICLYELFCWCRSILAVEDNIGMHFGIEVRYPFLDHELVDFAFQIPEHLMLYKGLEKGLLLKASKNILPKSVLDQYFNVRYKQYTKANFHPPLNNWLINNKKTKSFVDDILFSTKALNRDFRRKKLMRHCERAKWDALMIELWHQEFID